MKIVKPSAKLLSITPHAEKLIEYCGRKAHKSEDKITQNSYISFIQKLIAWGHESVLEHASATIEFICDRGITHELVRHRLASYTQESTRYVNYKEGITVIEPCFWKKEQLPIHYYEWECAIKNIENSYKTLMKIGATPQEARSVLPNSLKTEIVVTANFREWRHIIKLRTSSRAHPQIQEIMNIGKKILVKECPYVFGDL